MDRPEFTVQEFDFMAFLSINRRPEFSFVREEAGGAVIYTISDEVGKLGHFAITPGTRLSPYVYLELSSYATGMSAASPWFAFHSIPDSFKVVDERDGNFRTLCKCIFSDFLMMHNLDKAGRPGTMWEYVPQEGASSDNSENGIDRPGDIIYVPSKQYTLQRWKVTWRKIKGQWGQGKPYSEMCKWLEEMHSDLACTEKTLTSIIRAGQAGKLD